MKSWLRRLLPIKLIHKIDHEWIQLWMLRRGWRPSGVAAVEPLYAQGTFGYDDEANIKKAMLAVCGNTVLSFERLATLWHQVQHLDRFHIPGALVECGVFKGGAVGVMAIAHLASNPKPFRHLHLFDSFEGLPEPRADVDGKRAMIGATGTSGALKSIGTAVATPDEVRQLLVGRVRYPQELTHYHVGWFQKTLPTDASRVGDIALLRLDGDWYDSTKVCLEYLYPLVVRNGIVVIDDYGYYEGCRRAVDEFLAAQPEPIYLHHIDETGRYWIKP